MIDLTKKALPNTLIVDGKAFSIHTDYRVWMRFMIEAEHNKVDFDVSYLFKNEMPKRVSIKDLMVFASPKKELPRKIDDNNEIMLDFRLDSDLIYSAFLGQYGIDLVDIEYLHWHKFLALLSGITEGTKLAEVLGYRAYKKETKGDPYEKMKKAWRIEKETDSDLEEAEAFESLFV